MWQWHIVNTALITDYAINVYTVYVRTSNFIFIYIWLTWRCHNVFFPSYLARFWVLNPTWCWYSCSVWHYPELFNSGSIPGSGRSPGGGPDNPLQDSCPWTEKPGGLQSVELQRAEHDSATRTSLLNVKHPNFPSVGAPSFFTSLFSFSKWEQILFSKLDEHIIREC